MPLGELDEEEVCRQIDAGTLMLDSLASVAPDTHFLPITQYPVFAVAFETDSVGQDRHLMIHAEVPLRYLDVFATYHQRNFTSLFRLDDNDLIFAGARLQILPILFLNGRVQKSFEWNSAAFDGLGSYAENFNYQVDAEFGFQF